jgi:NADH:ubiquinone oxidoreductase subunit 6 (subunit J)
MELLAWSLFYIVGAVSIATAIGVVTARVAVHSALFLLAHFVSLAVLYISLNAQFLGAAQIIIYAGGIVILILFVIMLVGSQRMDTRGGHRTWVPYAGVALGLALMAGITYAVIQTPQLPIDPLANGGGVPQIVGMVLYTQNILLIELAAVLLLVALLGALLLARRPRTE